MPTAPRSLVVAALLAAGCPRARTAAPAPEAADAAVAGPPPAAGSVAVRVVAANLTSGPRQSYDPGEGIRILRGLRPDVGLLQELNYRGNTAADVRAFVDAAFGPSFYFVRGVTGSIPNGVASRYPIVAAGEWPDPEVANRAFTWARIDVPGDADLWAVSVHFVTASPARRATEAEALAMRLRREVPARDYLVVGGDLNTRSRDESCFEALARVVVTGGAHPTDQAGNDATNAGRSRPYDHVLADPDLAAREVPLVVGAQAFAHGLVFDCRTYAPLGDVAPARAEDCAAPNMQHMAVARAFRLGP